MPSPIGLLTWNPATSTTVVYPISEYASDDATENANFKRHRSENPVTVDIGGVEYQVVGWWSDDNYLCLSVRADGEIYWTTYRYDGSGGRAVIFQSAQDNHYTVALGIDSDGYLHLSYNHHGDALNYRRSSDPLDDFDGTLTAELSMVGTNEAVVTYPHFFVDPLGTLYFLFRDGGSGNGDTFFYVYDPSGPSWAAVPGTGTGGKLIDGKNSSSSESAYLNGPPVFTADWDGAGAGWMYLTWSWRESESGSSEHDLTFVKWDGEDWFHSDDDPQTIPITHENCDIFDALGTSTGLVGVDATTVDSAGQPHVVYKHGTTTQHLYHNHFNGTSWVKIQVDTGTSNDFDRARHDVVCDANDRIHIVHGNPTTGAGIYAYQSDGTDYTTWTLETVTAADIEIGDGGDNVEWCAAHDKYQWAEYGVYHALVPLTGAHPAPGTAFGTGWDGYATHSVDTLPGSPVEDFTFLISLNQMPSAWWNAVQADGDDIRASKEDGHELPVDVIRFTNNADGTGSGLIAVRWLGIKSGSVSAKVRVWAGNSGASLPSATAPYGRYAAYHHDTVGFYPDGGGDDRTRHVNHLSMSGSPTVGGVAALVNGVAATDYNGSSQYGTTTTKAPTTEPVTIIVWGNADNTTATVVSVGVTNTSVTDQFYCQSWRGAISGDPIAAQLQIGATAVLAHSATGYSAATWHQGVSRFRELFNHRAGGIDGVLGSTTGSSLWPSELATLAVGALVRTTVGSYFAGLLALVGVHWYDVPEPAILYAKEMLDDADQVDFFGTWGWTGGDTVEADWAEGIVFGDGFSGSRRFPASLADGVELADTFTAVRRLPATITDGVSLADTVTVIGRYFAALLEGVDLGDTLAGQSTRLADTTNELLAGDVCDGIVTRGGQTTDGIELGDAYTNHADLFTAVTEGIDFGDVLQAAIEGVATASFSGQIVFGDTLTARRDSLATITEGLVCSDVFTGVITKFASFTDGVELGDTYTSRAELLASIAEGIEVGNTWANRLDATALYTDGASLGDVWAGNSYRFTGWVEGVEFGDVWAGIIPVALLPVAEYCITASAYSTSLTGSSYTIIITGDVREC